MRKRLGVEGLHDDVDLLLEEEPVGFGIEHRAAERLHFSRVVPAADAEDHAPAGHDVGGGEILGQPQRMPHGRDVKAAADPKPRREVGQMDGRHQDVGDALVSLVLEVMLGEPESVVSVLVHAPRDRLGLLEHRGQVLVGIAPFVRRRGHLAHVAQIDVARIDGRELPNHVILRLAQPTKQLLSTSRRPTRRSWIGFGWRAGSMRPVPSK